MASPSYPTDSCRDLVAEPGTLSANPILTQKPSVEEGSVSAENANSIANKSLNLESTQDETQNLQDLEESDARDQQPEASTEERLNEEDDMDATQAVSSSAYRRGGGPKRKKGTLKKRKQQEKSKEKLEVLLKTLKPIPFVPGKTLGWFMVEKELKADPLSDCFFASHLNNTQHATTRQ